MRLKIPIAFLPAALAALAGPGCAQILGLDRQYPDAGDGAVEVQDDIEVQESGCEIQQPPYQVTTREFSGNGSWRFKLAMPIEGTGMNWGAIWMNAQANDGNLTFSTVGEDGALLMDPALDVNGSTNDSYYPDIAAADDGFGVTWEEEFMEPQDYEVRFDFISRMGELMLPSPVSISSEGYARNPAIVWNPDEQVFGLVWQDGRSGPSEIWFATMDREGAPEVTARVSDPGSDSTNPDIAWTGTEYGIAWINDSTGNSSIYFARINAAGSKTSADILVQQSSGSAMTPTITKDFSGFALSWSDSGEIYFTRLTWEGNRIINVTRLTSGGGESKNPHMAYELAGTANYYHICWDENRYTADYEIFVVTVDPSGSKLTGEGRATISEDHNSSECRLAIAPGVRGVFWQEFVDTQRQDIFFSGFSCTN